MQGCERGGRGGPRARAREGGDACAAFPVPRQPARVLELGKPCHDSCIDHPTLHPSRAGARLTPLPVPVPAGGRLTPPAVAVTIGSLPPLLASRGTRRGRDKGATVAASPVGAASDIEVGVNVTSRRRVHRAPKKK